VRFGNLRVPIRQPRRCSGSDMRQLRLSGRTGDERGNSTPRFGKPYEMPLPLPLDLISLKGLVEFFGSLVKELALKRLTPKKSQDQAKVAMLRLYLELADMQEKIDSFIRCVQGRMTGVFGPLFKQQLESELFEVLKCVDRINAQLLDLDPHLAIYTPEILASLEAFVFEENDLLEAKPDIAKIPDLSDRELGLLLQQATANRLVLIDAISKLREFIKSEIPFRESFG
jgi:hypothetical protein